MVPRHERLLASQSRCRVGLSRSRSPVHTLAICHAGSPSARIAEARTALGLSIDYTEQFKRFGDRLAKQKIAKRKVLQIASELWPDNGTDRQVRNAQARREAVLRLFTDGATIGNAPAPNGAPQTRSSNSSNGAAAHAPPKAGSCATPTTRANRRPARSNWSSMRRPPEAATGAGTAPTSAVMVSRSTLGRIARGVGDLGPWRSPRQ